MELIALFLGFYMAWNIGANDVANAMGTSVGSKALTIGKAILIAAVLEFAGAFFFGSNVTKTIQKGIISPEVFASDPTTFVLGMLGVLLSTGLLLQIASYFTLPVSTTHAIVGSVLGFGLFIGGPSAVQWSAVIFICSSWVVSPILSGVLAYLFFWLIDRKILSQFNPLAQIFQITPYLISGSIFCFGMIGLPFWASLLFGGISFALTLRLMSRRLVYVSGSVQIGSEKVEKIFIGLQVMSACLVAFAHGANDVSNAIGPVAAILSTLQAGFVDPETVVPSWLLAFGGLSMIIGLAMWGPRVIETVGKKITKLSPAKGFAAEFSTAMTVLSATKMGLPVSTTHALVGAIFGVGLVQGIGALNLKVFRSIVISWVITLPLCALFSSGTFLLLKWVLISA